MKQDLALRVLGEVMAWAEDRAREEFAWLLLMARLKYDGYNDYRAGARFIESLADWLQQFDRSERESAYEFIRHNLVYIDPAQMRHLVELVYPEIVQRGLAALVAIRLGIPAYRIWASSGAERAYRVALRKMLFMALSDGARIDLFRRVNVGIISNEQVVASSETADDRWQSLLEDLRKDLQDSTARFSSLFLLDDFIATGTTLLRWDEESGQWKGKLGRLWHHIQKVIETHLEDDWTLHVHHYIATQRAKDTVSERQLQAHAASGSGSWFDNIVFSYGIVLPSSFPIDRIRFGPFMQLIDKYYDTAIETSHTSLGGTDVRLGFGGSAIPLVLEHNTPNNAVALLWAETEGIGGQHAMRPLFRRRQRHI